MVNASFKLAEIVLCVLDNQAGTNNKHEARVSF